MNTETGKTHEEKMNDLNEFLKNVVKESCFHGDFAKAMYNNATDDHQEIRGSHTKTGNPVTFCFSDFGIEI